jgi:hypothetical protein
MVWLHQSRISKISPICSNVVQGHGIRSLASFAGNCTRPGWLPAVTGPQWANQAQIGPLRLGCMIHEYLLVLTENVYQEVTYFGLWYVHCTLISRSLMTNIATVRFWNYQKELANRIVGVGCMGNLAYLHPHCCVISQIRNFSIYI